MTKSHATPLLLYLQADINLIFFEQGAAKLSEVKVEGRQIIADSARISPDAPTPG